MSFPVTSGPITADAATNKVVGVKKSFTVTASAANKVTGLSKAEKKVVKVTKKGKKFTIKGLKAGKATFKIGKKSYIVKVGATAVKAAKAKVTLTAGKSAAVKFTATAGNGDTVAFTTSNKKVATLSKTSAKVSKNAAYVRVTAKAAGTAKITATSKITGKKATVKVTVKNATPVTTATPVVTETPVVTGGATTTPDVTATPVATGGATTNPDVTATPVATGGATTNPDVTATPVATGGATITPDTTATPEVVTGGTITVTGAAVSGATIIVTNASGAAVDTAKRLPAGTYTVSVTKDGYIAQTKEVKLEDKEAKVVEINLEKMLEVASVKALNRAEIQVTFTKALTATQEKAAKTATNYTVTKEGATTSTTVKTITVADDAKSVILLLDSTLDNGKTANTVKVAKAIGMFADYTDNKVASEDVNVPQVASVKAVGNKVVEIEFSEAVKLATAGDLDTDNMITGALNAYFKVATSASQAVTSDIDSAKLSANGRTVTLTFKRALPVDTYKVSVLANKFTDYASYAVSEVTKTVSIDSSVTVAKVTSVVAKSREKVAVTFDSAVTAGGTLSWKTAAGQGTSTSAELQADNKTIVYTFTGANIMKAGTTEFTLKGVVDAYGYTVADTTKTVDVPEETAATATVKSTADNKFVVTFDKVMQNKDGNTVGDSTNKASYSIVDPNGKAVSLTNATISVDTTKKIVTITTADNLASGNYTVTVSGVKDTMGVEMTKAVATVAVKDTTRPTVVGNAIYSGKKIAITFSEAMATTGTRSVLLASNYTYGGEALPEKATIQVSSDGKTIIITLPDDVDQSKKITIGGVKGDIYTVSDVAGNILNDGSNGYTKELSYAKDAAAEIANSEVSAVDTNTLRVEVKNATLETVYASDFEYTVDGKTFNDVTAAKLVTVNNKQYIDFTIGSKLSSAVLASNVKVRAKAVAANVEYKSVTALGTTLHRLNNSTAVANSVAVTVPQTSNGITASTTTWPFRTALSAAEVMNSETIKLTFDGLVKTDNLENIFVVSNGTKKTTTFTSTLLSDGKSVLLTGFNDTAAFTLDTAKAVTVSTKQYADVPAANWSYDGNGMKYTENTTGITASVETGLTVMDANAYTTVDGSTLFKAIAVDTATAFEIKFNQTVEKSSIYTDTTKWNAVSADTYGTDYNGGYELAATAEIATNGDLTFKDVNLGKLSGFTKDADATANTAKIVISKDLTKIKVIVGEAGKLSAYGKVTYTPSTAITSASTDKKITVNTTKVYEPEAATVANALIAKDVALLTAAATKADVVASAVTTIDLSAVAKNGTTVTVTETTDANELITVSDNKVTVKALTETEKSKTATFTIKVEKANGTAETKTATLTVDASGNTYTVSVA